MSNKHAIKHVCVERGVIYRLEREGKPVGLALALANGAWRLTDLAEKTLSVVGFDSPAAVARAAERRNMGA